MRGQVIYNGVIIRVSIEKPVEQKTKSGIILPTGLDEDIVKKMQLFKEHPYKGEVIQVGAHVTACKPGDIVLLASEALTPFIEDSIYYHYIREHDIIYVITKKEVDKLRKEEMVKEQMGKTSVILN
jgi:co-chaperonin GroES (HSP10)